MVPPKDFFSTQVGGHLEDFRDRDCIIQATYSWRVALCCNAIFIWKLALPGLCSKHIPCLPQSKFKVAEQVPCAFLPSWNTNAGIIENDIPELKKCFITKELMIISLALEDLFCFVLLKLEPFPTILWPKSATSYCVFRSFWPCFTLHFKMSSSYPGCKYQYHYYLSLRSTQKIYYGSLSSARAQMFPGF